MKYQNSRIIEWNLFKNYPVKTGITTRNGGVSSESYRTFNLATHTGDSKENVNKNRQILCDILECDPDLYTHGIQVHGDTIQYINKDNCGHNVVECDGIYTDITLPLLNIYVADCVPIAVYDRRKQIGGLCHCGWKGTELNLLQSMVTLFTKKYDSKPEDILIGIGPSIGSCCYNVSEDLYLRFSPGKDEGYIKNKNFYLDLKRINYNQALSVNIPHQNIEIMDLCTSCNTDEFYSYRKEGETTGRFSCFLKLTC